MENTQRIAEKAKEERVNTPVKKTEERPVQKPEIEDGYEQAIFLKENFVPT